MYFYIDESGNTGQRLFDPQQPNLYYGLLCCRKNIDVIAEPMMAVLRNRLGVKRLHAAELGVARLSEVAQSFCAFQKKNDVRLNFYKVAKRDHAVLSFFDQVFDSGMNNAVPWHAYWTPLRYLLLFKVAFIFDEELAEKAWKVRLIQNRTECAKKLKEICEELKLRVPTIPDLRSRDIINGALAWAIKHSEEIEYGTSNAESALQISPNLVGFQQVLQGVALRSKQMRSKVTSIVTDQQNEFNNAQKFLNDIYRKMRNSKAVMPNGMPTFDWSDMPDLDIEFRSSDQSAGLEMVDIYLWIWKRIAEGKNMSDEGHRLIYGQRHRGITDEVSLEGLQTRWSTLLSLPDADPDSMDRAREILQHAEIERLEALKGLI